jgi:hypothetical protein
VLSWLLLLCFLINFLLVFLVCFGKFFFNSRHQKSITELLYCYTGWCKNYEHLLNGMQCFHTSKCNKAQNLQLSFSPPHTQSYQENQLVLSSEYLVISSLFSLILCTQIFIRSHVQCCRLNCVDQKDMLQS